MVFKIASVWEKQDLLSKQNIHYLSCLAYNIEADVEIKRALLFALVHDYDNDKIDIVRAIEDERLNTHIRNIPIEVLNENRDHIIDLRKRWEYLDPILKGKLLF